jgi:hypothetical protein
MAKLQMFCVGLLSHDNINTIIQFVPNTPLNRPEHGIDMLATKKSESDFFLWGYIKDRVFVPPLPVSENDRKQHITTAVASVDKDMLRCVWNKLDYRIVTCYVSRCSQVVSNTNLLRVRLSATSNESRRFFADYSLFNTQR